MAQSPPRIQSRVSQSASNAPITLRQMRVEAIYRYETRNLDRSERDRYSNFLWNVMRLDMGPKLSLTDLIGESKDRALDSGHEDDLSTYIEFYTRQERETLIPVLRFFSAYLMQQARQAKDLRLQLFLVFKTVDLLRLIVQHSLYSVSYDAETMVGGIFADLGQQLPDRFRHYQETEYQIHPLMRRLHHTPNDHSARAQLAAAYASQTSFYDALVQYQVLLRVLPNMRVDQDRRRGLIHVHMGELFQGLADMNMGGLQDGRKLRNFIARYNRDHPARNSQLPPLTGANPAALRQLQRGFRDLAIGAYSAAIQVHALEPHVLLASYEQLGRSLVAEGRYKEAAGLLREGNRFYRPAADSPLSLAKRLTYLELLANAAGRGRLRELFDSVQIQITDVRKRQRDVEAAASARQQRRAAMLSPEEKQSEEV